MDESKFMVVTSCFHSSRVGEASFFVLKYTGPSSSSVNRATESWSLLQTINLDRGDPMRVEVDKNLLGAGILPEFFTRRSVDVYALPILQIEVSPDDRSHCRLALTLPPLWFFNSYFHCPPCRFHLLVCVCMCVCVCHIVGLLCFYMVTVASPYWRRRWESAPLLLPSKSFIWRTRKVIRRVHKISAFKFLTQKH